VSALFCPLPGIGSEEYKSVWSQKAVLLLFYRRLIHHTSWGRVALRLAWFVLFATYAAVQVTTFTECRPFRNYYLILPKPGMHLLTIIPQRLVWLYY
jgi:hypothetical protein